MPNLHAHILTAGMYRYIPGLMDSLPDATVWDAGPGYSDATVKIDGKRYTRNWYNILQTLSHFPDSDFVWMVSDDVVLSLAYPNVITDFVQSNQNVGVVVPAMLYQHHRFAEPSGDVPVRVTQYIGAAPAIRLDLLRACWTEKMCELLPIGWGVEMVVAHYANKMGLSMWRLDNAPILHHCSSTYLAELGRDELTRQGEAEMQNLPLLMV